jgi:hypothetical protein
VSDFSGIVSARSVMISAPSEAKAADGHTVIDIASFITWVGVALL